MNIVEHPYVGRMQSSLADSCMHICAVTASNALIQGDEQCLVPAPWAHSLVVALQADEPPAAVQEQLDIGRYMLVQCLLPCHTAFCKDCPVGNHAPTQ